MTVDLALAPTSKTSGLGLSLDHVVLEHIPVFQTQCTPLTMTMNSQSDTLLISMTIIFLFTRCRHDMSLACADGIKQFVI